MSRRRAALVIVIALACGAAAMAGAAATLGVSSRSIDSFSAAVPASTTTTAAGDVTAPALTSLEMFDTNANGKVDQVKATFNETLAAYTAGNAPWTLANVPSGGSLGSVSVAGTVATLTITEGAGAADTAVGTFTVALAQDANGIRDAAGNKSSFAASAPTDKASPVPTLIEYRDVDTNAVLDQIRLTYSEALVAGTLTGTTWSISGGPAGMVSADLTGVSAAGTQVSLAYSETNGTATAQATVAPSFLVSHATNGAAGVRDQAPTPNLAATFSNRTTLDGAAPVRTLMEMKDNDTDGLVDRIEVTFSEALDSYTAGTTPWTLGGAIPSGGTLASVTAASPMITLNIAEGGGDENTAVGTLTVALATNANGVRDSAGNQSSFAATAPTDKAAPLLLDFIDEDTSGSGADGTFENGDWIQFVFSEAIGTAPASMTVSLVDEPSNSPSARDFLTIPDVVASTNLGSDGYLLNNNSTVTFPGALSFPAANIVQVTLGACSGTACTNLSSSVGNVSITVASTVLGTDGLGVVGTVSKTNYRMF